MNLLITGAPGIGKTTLTIKVADRLRDLHPVGFYTREIRLHGGRQGFEAVALDGSRQLLAHIGIESPHRVGKYGVDTVGFERFLAGLDLTADSASPIILDEIGRMECFSARFNALVAELLVSGRPILATVALRGSGLIASVKKRPDIQLYELTVKNRNELADDLTAALRRIAMQ